MTLAIAPMEASYSPTGIALMCCFLRYDTISSPIVRSSHFHLYQQRLYEIMLELVKEYPPALQPEYLAAAKSWRFPYWDWAAKKQVKNVPTKYDYTVPQIVLPKTVRVEVSRGSWTALETIPNPMYAFHLPDDIPMGSPAYGDNGLQSDGGFYVSILIVS